MTPLEHIMGLMDPSHAEPIRRSFAQSILDKHAHELAEQIRETAANWGGVPDMDAGDAADLIDPAIVGRDAEGNPA